MLGNSRRLQDFPRCSKLQNLSSHLDEWTECLNLYCSELLHAPGILRSMLLGVIPADFEDELLANPQVKTWHEMIQWCKIKTIYKRQKILAEQARRPGGRVNSVLSHIEVEVDRTSAPVATAAEVAPAPDGAPAWFNGAMQDAGVHQQARYSNQEAWRGCRSKASTRRRRRYQPHQESALHFHRMLALRNIRSCARRMRDLQEAHG